MVLLFSASNQSTEKLVNKSTFLAIGLIAMWVVANISPQTLGRLALPGYILGMCLLIAVAGFGDIVNGARRWLNLGITRIQPSELMKIAVPLVLAWFFSLYEANIKVRHYFAAAIMIGMPAILVLKQPDLGTALLISAAGFYILFFAGLSWRIIGLLALVGAIGIYIVMDWDRCTQLFHDFQCRRIEVLKNPMDDPLGAGYHTIQGTIAIGSGGVFGKGWLKGTQTHLDFIPERTTDFIFAVYSEEFGLMGNLVLLILYLLVIGRAFIITSSASTLFGRLLAGSITLTLSTYVFVNMGMVSGILPIVGVPLPLMSYGGTSMLSIMICIGLLMSIQRHRKLMKS